MSQENDDIQISKELCLLYKEMEVKSVHEAAITAIHLFAMELGFSLKGEDYKPASNLRKVVDQDLHCVILRYTHDTCPDIKCYLKYVILNNNVMIYAFADNVMANGSPINIYKYINVNISFWNIEEVYFSIQDFSIVIKNEYLLKMLAEAQHKAGVCSSFGITKIPHFILEDIFLKLDLKDITPCALVNKNFNEVLSWQSFWRKFYCKRYHVLTPDNDISDWRGALRNRELKKRSARKPFVQRCDLRPRCYPPFNYTYFYRPFQ